MRVTPSCGFVLILLFVFTLAGTSGCALLLVGGAGGAAGYAYAAGEHEKLYPYPVATTWAAVRESVAEMQLPIVNERADALRARLESKTASGEKVSIALEAKGEAVTEVGIRIGTFGDSTASRLLFEKIDARLPGPYPAAAAPAKPDVHVGVSVSR
jgi:hypothetical protein